MRFFSAIVFCAAAVSKVSAHSWVHCTDYRVSNPEEQIVARTNPLDDAPAERILFDVDLCLGYPPSFPTFVDPTVIGVDAGYNVQVGGDQLCPPNRRNEYSAQFPVATYTAGEFHCVAHPTKNHVADNEANVNIPDTDMSMLYTPEQQTLGADFPARAAFEDLPHLNGVHVNGQEDYLGFQNCPNFLNNNDRSLCTLCFEVPDLDAGVYSFAWAWIFNNGGTPYTTCWNANVIAAGDDTPTERENEVETEEETEEETETTPVTTVAGECDEEGILACTRGLVGRGECIPTEDGFTCDCEAGFEVAGTDQMCAFTEAVQIRITFGVLFEDIEDEGILTTFLLTEIASILGVSEDRLSITEFEADANGFLVAVLAISGQSEQNDPSGVVMATTLADFLSDEDSVHNFGGFMANSVGVECVNCEEVTSNTGVVEDSSASAVVPSFVALASLTALMH